jgi:hypothetical protein
LVANSNPFTALETINAEEEDLKHTQGGHGRALDLSSKQETSPKICFARKSSAPPSNPHSNTGLRFRKQKKENPFRSP